MLKNEKTDHLTILLTMIYAIPHQSSLHGVCSTPVHFSPAEDTDTFSGF